MFGFTKKTEYALVALTRLVQQERCQGDPLSARQIAEEFNLPTPLLMNVMKELQREGIVNSIRGAKGGYQLQPTPETLSVLTIVEAIEGPVRVAACCNQEIADDGSCSACNMLDTCPIVRTVHQLHDRVISFLEELTLEDFVNNPNTNALSTHKNNQPIAAATSTQD